MNCLTDHKTPVNQSDISEFFDAPKMDDVFLLSQNDSSRVFSMFVDPKAKSYWDLDNQNWIVSGDRSDIADWITPYNKDNNALLSDFLREHLKWDDNDTIYFISKRSLVVESSWKSFLLSWDSFLALEDDCPIIVSPNRKGIALLFKPIGRLEQIQKKV